LESLDPDLVFNLVESLGGHGRLIHLFPVLLDAMGVLYTGSQTETIWMTSHKVMAKRYMLAAGIQTPAWVGPYPKDLTSTLSPKPSSSTDGSAQNWIIKSLWEHASVGLESDSIISKASGIDICMELSKRAAGLGGACFAEDYIHGREFNLSILAGYDGPQVLPPAEIIFEGFDRSRPLIVGYRAKWKTDSFEYRHTPRRFDFDSEDETLLAVLKDLALKCWQVFGLRGYARVDFRVDGHGTPWILEINANPCISPDAGFVATVNAAGIDLTEAVDRIIQDGMIHHAHFSRGVAVDPSK
jgi:D-alanine-D-alanine ligase